MEAKKFKRGLHFKQHLMGYIFLLPTVILFLIFTVVPFVMSFYIAFTDYNLVVMKGWEGFENFKTAFMNTEFMRSFLNILLYVVMFVPLTIITSLLAAVLVNSSLKGVKIMRIIFYLPAVTGGVAIAFVWGWIYNTECGLLNGILRTLGMSGLNWLDSRSYFVMVCVVIVAVWSGVGGNMLIFLAALKGISPEYYEAAELDGANGFTKLTKITVPLIAPTMYFITTMTLIGAFQMFDLIYIMVPAGSMEWARTPVVMIYEIGFTRFRGGLGTAMSLILFAVIMIVTFIFQRFAKEDNTL